MIGDERHNKKSKDSEKKGKDACKNKKLGQNEKRQKKQREKGTKKWMDDENETNETIIKMKRW